MASPRRNSNSINPIYSQVPQAPGSPPLPFQSGRSTSGRSTPQSPRNNPLPSSGSMYIPPLEAPGRPTSALQPAPSLASFGNRDSSYASSLNTEDERRGSWSSNAMLSPPAGVQRTHSSSPLNPSYAVPPQSPPVQNDSPDPAFATTTSPRSYPSRTSLPPGARSAQPSAQMQMLPMGTSSLGWTRDPNAEDDDDDSGEISGSNEEKPRWAGGAGVTPPGQGPAAYRPGVAKRRTWVYWVGGCLTLLLLLGIGLGVGLGIHFSHKDSSNSGSSNQDSSDGSNTAGTPTTSSKGSKTTSAPTPVATSGTNGSTLIFLNGTTTTYVNPYGGSWAYDESNPLLLTAQPNSWTPPLNESWDYTQTIRGVNLGGWFVTEPFIVPSLYEQYANGSAGTAVDEFTLSINMGSDLASVMENHYDTFITEQDIMEIAAAGLNWVRLPIPYWAIETWEGEPFLEGVAWNYIVRALQWCRKYGIRVNLDLHATPGSQNGWNHSGRIGEINWLAGVMGLANVQRSINYIRTILEFIIQPEWQATVPMFGILNEPFAVTIGQENVAAFYIQMHDMIRSLTGIGQGHGPVISIHEGFLGVSNWYGVFSTTTEGPDRMMLDVHQYTVFQDQDPGPMSELVTKPCTWWASSTNVTMNQWGPTNTGEWSGAINDCGLWVNGVGLGSRYDGTFAGYADKAIGSCDYWNDPTQWNASTVSGMNQLYLAAFDALQSQFHWTWKIGASTVYDYPVNPFWHYKYGLERGWIPSDPRVADGYCLASVSGVTATAFTGYEPYMTGGTGAGTIPASDRSKYTWPPTSMQPSLTGAQLSSLPQYTQTGTPVTLANPSYTSLAASASSSLESGWAITTDTAAAYTAIAGCSYPNEYSAQSIAVPTSACGAGAFQTFARREAMPGPTPAPKRS